MEYWTRSPRASFERTDLDLPGINGEKDDEKPNKPPFEWIWRCKTYSKP